jgi:hypothetical protein
MTPACVTAPIAAVLILVSATIPCLAQGGASTPPKAAPALRSLNVVTRNSGELSVRVLPSPDAKGVAQTPTVFNGPEGTVRVDVRAAGKHARIAVDDVKSGTTAIVALPAGDTVKINPVQFDHIRSVEVHVTHEGLPVKAASVTLQNAKQSRSVSIDSAMSGVAQFDDVPIGDATITVLYGNKHKEVRQTDLNAPEHGGPLHVTVTATNDVATVPLPNGAAASATPPPAGAPVAAPSVPGPGQPAPPAQSGWLAWLNELIGAVIVIGALYGMYHMAKTGRLAAILKGAGIEVQPQAPGSDAGTPWNPNPSPPPVVADPSLCPYCGQKKDATGGCACTIAGGGAAVATPHVQPQPRLIGSVGVYAGSIFALPAGGGAASIGREPTNAIALPNDNTVSRRHASLRAEGGAYALVDEGSANGVFVNGVRVAGSQPVNPGDEVQIGNTRFRFEI